MLELVFTVCSIVQGAKCEQLPPIELQTPSMMACMISTQLEGARWVGEHPNHYIQRATCQPARMFSKA